MSILTSIYKHKNGIEIHIDNRENWNLSVEFLNKTGYVFDKKTLDVGDIHVYKNGEIQLIIERKTLNDLASSITSERYEEQKQRLYRLKNEGFKIVYLLEGNFNEYSGIFSHVHRDTLKTVYLKFLMRDKIQVIRTSCLEETIDLIQQLCICIDKCKFDIKPNKDINHNKGFKKDIIQPENCFAYQIQVIPGVSLSIADGISKYFSGQWLELYKFLETESDLKKKIKKLSGLKLEEVDRKIGLKTAEKIIQYMFPSMT